MCFGIMLPITQIFSLQSQSCSSFFFFFFCKAPLKNNFLKINLYWSIVLQCVWVSTHSRMNQPYIYVSPLPFGLPSHSRDSLHSALSRVPCDIQYVLYFIHSINIVYIWLTFILMDSSYLNEFHLLHFWLGHNLAFSHIVWNGRNIGFLPM